MIIFHSYWWNDIRFHSENGCESHGTSFSKDMDAVAATTAQIFTKIAYASSGEGLQI